MADFVLMPGVRQRRPDSQAGNASVFVLGNLQPYGSVSGSEMGKWDHTTREYEGLSTTYSPNHVALSR